MHWELTKVWGTVDLDPEVRVVLVTGAGKAFSAGGDLDRVKNSYQNHDVIVDILEEARDIVYNMLHCSKPIISAVNGVAVGAGVVVALLSDICIMAEGARLADGHHKLGVAAGDHGAIIWPLLCGMAKAKYYLMTGDFISGTEAERIGLVSLCVPDAQLLDKTMEVATKVATGPKYATRFTKRTLNQWMLQAGPIFDHSLALEMMGFFSKDLLEGVDSVRGKRPAKFPSNE
jgi:enoyl-CoA hydratase